MCRKMADNNNLSSKSEFPQGNFEIVEDEKKDTTIVEKSIKKLEQHGDAQIQKAVSEYRKGKRKISFDNMSQNQLGQTNQINDFYCHAISEKLIQDTPENEIRLAITLAHEFKRNAVTDTLEGETRDIVLSDTKIIESFAGTYGEEIYKKFPEYGILHYIKKIFGEEELKDFADYAFDSTGSYWKVNETCDLVDDGNSSNVIDKDNKTIHSGTNGLQGTLGDWLGIDNTSPTDNVFTKLMKPAGYVWNGKKWIVNPGKIKYKKIEEAHNTGKITDDQFNMILLAAGLISEEQKEKKEEKPSLFSKILQDYVASEQLKTQIQIDFVKRTWEFFFGKKSKKTKNSASNSKSESTQSSKNVEISEDNNINYIKSDILNSMPSLIPTVVWNKEKMGEEQLFATSVDETKCNLFLPKYLESISEKVYNDIITEKDAKASRLNELFKNNNKLYIITGSEYDVTKRIPEKNRQGKIFVEQTQEYSAAKKAIIAQDCANDGKLVIAYVTDHVAVVTKQDTCYSSYPEKNWNPEKIAPIQSGNGYSNGIVLDGFPVFLQSGSYTGVVNPEHAMGRNALSNDEVIYYVYKG